MTRLWSWLRALLQTPVIDQIAPPDPIDDLKELRRLHGLVEIQRSTRENLVVMDSRRRPRS